jgi:peptide/nickel transport system substrate-binding protein
MKRIARIAGFLMAACCASSSVVAGADVTRHPYTQPHVLRFSADTDIAGLNPLLEASQYEMYLAALTMAYLIKTDRNGAPVPELITEVPTQKNGGISKDGLSITWHLRRGVVWSDGAPFTADDVVFSTQQVLNPANNVATRDGWELITKIDEPDKYTVVYHLKKPYGAYAATFFSTVGANPAVMPKHLLAGLPNLNQAPYNALPVGIGPFKYKVWNRGQDVRMVANDQYFRGRPKLNEIVFSLIQDRNTIYEQTRTHEIDLWIPVPAHYFNDVKSIPNVTVKTIPAYVFDHLDFNLSHAVVADPAVRTALRYATDRKTLNDKIGLGLYDLSEAVVPKASPLYDAKLGLVPFDLAKANAILDRAGWVRGPDGVRAKNGLRLSLDLATTSGSQDADQKIELIRSWWQQIGAEIVVHRYLASLFFDAAQNGGIIYAGKFDIVLFAWGLDPNPDLANLYSCHRFPPNGQNDPRYCSQSVTNAIEKAAAMYDPEQRRPLMMFEQEQIFKDVPVIVLDSRREIFAFNDDLKNFNPGYSNAPFDDMMNVDI